MLKLNADVNEYVPAIDKKLQKIASKISKVVYLVSVKQKQVVKTTAQTIKPSTLSYNAEKPTFLTKYLIIKALIANTNPVKVASIIAISNLS